MDDVEHVSHVSIKDVAPFLYVPFVTDRTWNTPGVPVMRGRAVLTGTPTTGVTGDSTAVEVVVPSVAATDTSNDGYAASPGWTWYVSELVDVGLAVQLVGALVVQCNHVTVYVDVAGLHVPGFAVRVPPAWVKLGAPEFLYTGILFDGCVPAGVASLLGAVSITATEEPLSLALTV